MIVQSGDNSCKGKIYRARKTVFVNADGMVTHKEILKPLKSKSCPGCKNCGFLEEELQEYVIMNDEMPPIYPNFNHGKLYSLEIKVVSIDPETRYADVWFPIFNQVEE